MSTWFSVNSVGVAIAFRPSGLEKTSWPLGGGPQRNSPSLRGIQMPWSSAGLSSYPTAWDSPGDAHTGETTNSLGDMNRRNDGHADPKPHCRRLVRIETDAHRQSLNNLREVSRGIVWCHGGIADPAGWTQTVDGSC